MVRHLNQNFCPSQIILKIDSLPHKLIYIKTHIGHSLNSIHTKMPIEIKNNVAKMLKKQMDRDFIIRNSKKTFGRYLTKTDLRNISIKFNINLESRFHSNDIISVDEFVRDFAQKGHHVLCYKKVGEKHDYLLESDFLFGKINQ